LAESGTGLVYQAIPAAELDAIRAAGRDEAGNPLEAQVHGEGGAPLRCCLREARAGQKLHLRNVGYGCYNFAVRTTG